MAKSFSSTSTQYLSSLDTTVASFETSQPWSVFFYHYTGQSAGEAAVAKWANNVGWEVVVRNSTATGYQYQAVFQTSSLTASNVRTTSDFTTGVWRDVCVTYDGSGRAPGFGIYVGSAASQSLTSVANSAAPKGSSLNTFPVQIGARVLASVPNLLSTGSYARVLVYNRVLTASERTQNSGGTSVATNGLVFWQELSDLGETLQPDYSGNGHTFTVTNSGSARSYLAGPVADLLPVVSGISTLMLPLTRSAPQPLLQNLGWSQGSNNSQADQIGPGWINKTGPTTYQGWFENNSGKTSLDPTNQPGAFDFDTPTIYGTSTDGTNWSLVSQDIAAGAVINVNNMATNPAGSEASFKSGAHGETSVGCMLFDPDDNVWKAFGHCGNNTGPREIYYFSCSSGSQDPTFPGCWVVQNSGAPVIPRGAAGSTTSAFVVDIAVLRLSSNTMIGVYRGNDKTTDRILASISTTRGSTWSALGTAINVGAAGQWDSVGVHGPAFCYDAPTGNYVMWYGGAGANTVAAGSDGIGMSYTTQPWVVPYTKGIYNPVYCKADLTGGTTKLEDVVATTDMAYLDGRTYRIMVRSDNGVSGVTGFRGRIELTLAQQVFPAGGGADYLRRRQQESQ